MSLFLSGDRLILLPTVGGDKSCLFVALPVSHEAPPYSKAGYSEVIYSVVENNETHCKSEQQSYLAVKADREPSSPRAV